MCRGIRRDIMLLWQQRAVTKGKNEVAMAATAAEVYVYKLHKSISRYFWEICLSELNDLVH